MHVRINKNFGLGPVKWIYDKLVKDAICQILHRGRQWQHYIIMSQKDGHKKTNVRYSDLFRSLKYLKSKLHCIHLKPHQQPVASLC